MNRIRRAALSKIQDALLALPLPSVMEQLRDIADAIETQRDEEQDAFDNLPESLQTDDKEYSIDKMTEAFDALNDFIESFDDTLLDSAIENIENARGQA